jgi:hypothetical protein
MTFRTCPVGHKFCWFPTGPTFQKIDENTQLKLDGLIDVGEMTEVIGCVDHEVIHINDYDAGPDEA